MPNPKSEVLSIPLMASLTIPLPGRRYTDMESEDYHFYQGLVYLLENDVSTLGYDLTFSTEVHVTPAPPNPGDPPKGTRTPKKQGMGMSVSRVPPLPNLPGEESFCFRGVTCVLGGSPSPRSVPSVFGGGPSVLGVSPSPCPP